MVLNSIWKPKSYMKIVKDFYWWLADLQARWCMLNKYVGDTDT